MLCKDTQKVSVQGVGRSAVFAGQAHGQIIELILLFMACMMGNHCRKGSATTLCLAFFNVLLSAQKDYLCCLCCLCKLQLEVVIFIRDVGDTVWEYRFVCSR